MGDQFEFVTVERLPVGNLQLKRRAGGHTALEILHLAESTRILTNILALLEVLEDEPDSDDDDSDIDDDSDDEAAEDEIELLELLGILHAWRIIDIDNPKTISLRSIVPKEVTVQMYSDDECWRLLRFRKSDVVKLMGLLNIPPHLISRDRHSFPREFAFILLLRRMAYPGRLTDLETEFGREHTALSRCISLIVQWLNEHHSRRITDNLAFWMPYQQRYAAAVAQKVDLPAGMMHVNSFLDGTQKSVCRPGDGPDRPHDAQHMWYSGYYRAHGFKMQSMMYPSGKLFPRQMQRALH